ncbi:hypothetical protein MUA95_01520 [Staphylococcus agnetis]|uniref:Uncharacterized protein n=1 Tax=Staphylococcus agnetis TaxID=985762 RepID=A0ABD7TTC5_9STAP|nr:hypothetical protein [Staphylococcus agnetis]UXU57516.1 hypothetical protein MUA95_01520 [Staphylococcus agnetis]
MSNTDKITQEIILNYDFNNYERPSDFIDKTWNFFKENYKSNNSINGKIFENLIVYILAYEGIKHIYEQAEVVFVPNAIFDIVLYHPKKTFTLSLKTTLRERWKQADLEAYAIKNVLKESSSYVITLSENEVITRRKKYKIGEDFYNGLDGFILANTEEFDKLVSTLKGIDFVPSEKISIIKKEDRYSTLENLNTKFDL